MTITQLYAARQQRGRVSALSVETVLIVDSSLSFAFWLCQALDAEGYCALPARNVDDAIALLNKLETRVDAVLIDQGQAAGAFAALIRQLNPSVAGLKVIVICKQPDKGVRQTATDEARTQEIGKLVAFTRLGRPLGDNEASKIEFIERIKYALGTQN